jgi:hypothetical protein
MSFSHDWTITETDSGWLQQPQFSGKIPSAKQIFFPEKHFWCTDWDRTHNPRSINLILHWSRAPHADLKMVMGLLVSQ